MSDFAKWLSETTFCDCEEWCVHAEVQRLAAQQHEALFLLMGKYPTGVGPEHAEAAIKAAEALKEKYG